MTFTNDKDDYDDAMMAVLMMMLMIEGDCDVDWWWCGDFDDNWRSVFDDRLWLTDYDDDERLWWKMMCGNDMSIDNTITNDNHTFVCLQRRLCEA